MNEIANKIDKVLRENYHIYEDKNISTDMAKFVDMMLEYNEIHNLTSITDIDEVLLKHLLDSVWPIYLLKPNQKILDIGCGAGFPSLPLAIANRELNITAIDSVQKKTDFVKSVKDELKLDNFRVEHVRIEDFARIPEEREQYDIVVSRAVAPLNVILEYSAPMLKNGGFIYAYKGVNYESEIKIAKRAMRLLDCEVVEMEGFVINELEMNRYLIKLRKKSKIIDKYPRKQNKPRTKPI